MIRALVATTLILTTSGCIHDDQWTFGISRSFYAEGSGLTSFGDALESETRSDPLPGAAALIVLLPVALDLVLLPVSGVRDLCVYGLLEQSPG